jgi:hypothetical protein
MVVDPPLAKRFSNYPKRRGGYMTYDWIPCIHLYTLIGQKLDTFYPLSNALSLEKNHFIDDQIK